MIFSHTATNLGSLRVKADVTKEHEEVTWQEFYERDVQDFYVRDVQDFYVRNVQDFFVRDVQDFYQRECYDRYQPVFEKKISSIDGTLTSLLSGSGGTFNNGMVWLKLEVGKDSTIGIAKSDPGNTSIGYNYHVSFNAANDKLTISFNSRFIGTSITAKVYNTQPDKHDNSGHTNLGPEGSITVNLPDGHGDSVYLYVHFDGIRWYTTGEYEFVEWRYMDTICGENEKVRTDTGDYVKVKTENGDYILKETREISRKTVQDPYDVEFDLVVKNGANEVVYTGKIANKGEVFIPYLLPGVYTATLNGEDITEQVKSATVFPMQTSEIVFDGIKVIGEQVDIFLPDVKDDNKLSDVKDDNKLPDVKDDNKLPDVKDDNKLPDVNLDDKKLDDVYLGNETDPTSKWAIRLN